MSRGLVLILSLWTLVGCKDGLVEPERFGSLAGTVVDFETGQPIAGAGVTTSPATDAIVTDTEGAFTIPDALTGSYTITATRNGYDPNTTTISVREGRAARATLFLRPAEDDDDTGTDVVFGAEVLNFTNETFPTATGTDSTFVNVEYRALNNGDVDISTYEIYFRIDTDRGPFYQEVRGEALAAGQRDFGTFRKYVLGATASAVIVEDTQATEADDTTP